MTTDRHGYQPTGDIGTPPDIDDHQHQTTGTPELCCPHGQQLVDRLDRIAQILEEIRDARRAKAPDVITYERMLFDLERQKPL